MKIVARYLVIDEYGEFVEIVRITDDNYFLINNKTRQFEEISEACFKAYQTSMKDNYANK